MYCNKNTRMENGERRVDITVQEYIEHLSEFDLALQVVLYDPEDGTFDDAELPGQEDIVLVKRRSSPRTAWIRSCPSNEDVKDSRTVVCL